MIYSVSYGKHRAEHSLLFEYWICRLPHDKHLAEHSLQILRLLSPVQSVILYNCCKLYIPYHVTNMEKNIPDTLPILSYATNMARNIPGTMSILLFSQVGQTWRETYQVLCLLSPTRQTWRETYQILYLARSIPDTISVLSHATITTRNKHTRYLVYVCSLSCHKHGVKHTRYYV